MVRKSETSKPHSFHLITWCLGPVTLLSPASSHPSKCSLSLTKPNKVVGQGGYLVQKYLFFFFFLVNLFIENLNSQLQTSEHYPKPHLHFWAPLKRARSFGVSPTSIILAPAKSCMMRPEVTMGEIPSSINVP